jgi:SAM-dependent methyltransferase
MTEADLGPAAARFRAEYGAHRAAEGRTHGRDELLALPYLKTGPIARQWSVRARSFGAFVRHVLRPAAAEVGRPLRLLDLGAGSGWLCYRAALAGHRGVALDVRDDAVDGLGAAGVYLESTPGMIGPVAASFDALPLRPRGFDVAVFNASLHYALDLRTVLEGAAATLRPGGRLVILDSPFYAREEHGAAMVAEKRRDAAARFGGRADALLGLPFIEFLTRGRLAAASAGLGLAWRRHRVLYPLWYEVRPLAARLRGRRPPSRFDLWQSKVP